MSRESDSSSSGPRGRGGAAYPSGTPPYGSRPYPSQDGPLGGADEEARGAARPEEPKTETTLTTRIRINIPGSRPIPPVVMRKPVGDDGAAGGDEGGERGGNERTGATARPDATVAMAVVGGDQVSAGVPAQDAPKPKPEAKEKKEAETSDWFAPRKSRGGSGSAGASSVTGSTPLPPQPAPAVDPAGPETTQAFPTPPQPGAGLSEPPYFADGYAEGRADGFSGAPQDGFAGAPQDGFSGAPQNGYGGGGQNGFAGGSTTDFPGTAQGFPGSGQDFAGAPQDYPGAPQDFAGVPQDFPGAGQDYAGAPAGGFPGGPAEGYPAGAGDGFSGGAPGGYPGGGFPGDGFAGADPTQGAPTAITPELRLGGPAGTTGQHPLPPFPPGPAGPTTGPAGGDMPVPPATGPGMDGGFPGQPPTPPSGAPLSGGLGATTGAAPFAGNDLFRDADPTPGGGVPGAHVSGETLVSGIPSAPPAQKKKKAPAKPAQNGAAKPGAGSKPSGKSSSKSSSSAVPDFSGGQAGPLTFAPSTASSGRAAAPAAASAATPGPAPAPAAAPPAPPAASGKKSTKPAKKKGRSKLVMVGAGLVGVVGVAYAAGLVLNHADVPNGTTVLGIDIGGSSKEDAVQKLDDTLGKRASAPLKVTVDGEQHQLKPSVAGLSLDTEGTVRDVSGRDYNPVNVIGSLVGSTRTAGDPVVVDEEKLSDALERLAGESGTSSEGTIEFVPGKAQAVYGKPGKGLNVDAAVKAVSDAFRHRAETGEDKAVVLPVVTREPKIANSEIDAKMKSFAEPAMSGIVTVKAGTGSIQFGPERSLPKILSMRVVDGRLQEHYDLEAVKALYGNAFDGVLIERGTGGKTPVTPEDVVGAMRQALLEKDPAKRVAVIPLSPN
ncbi:hypothetical protein [Streptomyces sp. SAJ15]|uniref:hypothetical protein n=1 Tax=Streptomyces sp. SAJ15 TaxID=2011095 RepID=UPI001642D6DC|nr:hypothetical protein [Streptomyces sp. SAJ15]